MNKFIEIWKNKAKNKEITAKDTVAYCILKTIAAKSENKEEVLKYYLGRAFSAGKIAQHRHHPFSAVHLAAEYVRNDLKYRNKILGEASTTFLTSVEDIELFSSLVNVAYDYGRM